MKKIVTIIGARPQFIKMPLISKELRKFAQEIVIHTGQHYDANMSDIFFRELKLPKVDYNLGVGSASHGVMTAKMLERIEAVLFKEKPDLAIIYGDTNSTVAGALAAVKLHIPVAHVEAGMRSYNRQMPEEHNRVVSDHLSDLLFCPTESSVKILKGEGIKKGVYWTGDVMFDLQKIILKNKKPSKIILKKFHLEPKKYLFVTVHRQENTDKKENLKNILMAFKKINEIIIYPIHPRTKKYIKLYNFQSLVKKAPNLRIIDAVSYLDSIRLLSNAKIILTDSGGVQKEAYVAKVPCITLRNETEWAETVKSCWNQLAGTDVGKIIRLVNYFPSASWQRENHPNFLGDGRAYLKIARIIKNYLSK